MARITSFRLSVFYLLYFLAVGVTLPFLPAYFQSLGLSAAHTGMLLSVAPVFSLSMPPLWGLLADRTSRPGLVLLGLCVGVVLGYTVLLGATTFATALLAMAVYSVFGSSMTTLVDSISLSHVKEHGGDYAHLRRWGSLGFVLATLAFGFSVSRIDKMAVLAPIALLLLATLWCALTLARAPRSSFHAGPRPNARSALALLKDRRLALFLLATTLHWVAGTPFHGSLSRHYGQLGLAPWAIGLTWAVAVGSEVVVMSLWPRFSNVFGERTLLVLTFSISALRWLGMSLTSNVLVLTALAGSHGVVFGAFYVAAVAQVARLVPDSLRATGQALFVATTFGVGGLVGFSSSGLLYGVLGGHGLFALAAGVELLPIAVVLLTKSGHTKNNAAAAA